MLREWVQDFFDRVGYTVTSKAKVEIGMEEFREIYEAARAYTMTTKESMYSLYKAVEYLVKHRIPGDLVECGTWKGGSAMVAALALKKLGDTTRRFYLYDTYEGMSEPTDKDVNWHDVSAKDELAAHAHEKEFSVWCCASLDEVRRNLLATGYPSERLVFVKGKVEDTIPGTMPERIALLRLDTDWHASTAHELSHLFPRLATHGVLIINDYGFWKGAREATDEYFAAHQVRMLLHRTDYTERIGVKT